MASLMMRSRSSLDMRMSCFVIAMKMRMCFVMSKRSWLRRLKASLLRWATMTPKNSAMISSPYRRSTWLKFVTMWKGLSDAMLSGFTTFICLRWVNASCLFRGQQTLWRRVRVFVCSCVRVFVWRIYGIQFSFIVYLEERLGDKGEGDRAVIYDEI